MASQHAMAGFGELSRSDPILQRIGMLLRILCEATSRYHVSTDHNSTEEQRLSLLRATSDCLGQLQQTLEHLRNSLAVSQFHSKIDFITVPVRATLRVCGESSWDGTKSPVEESLNWKCMQLSCRLLQTTIEMGKDLSDSMLLSGLTICSLVLPSGSYLADTDTRRKNDLRLECGEECLIALFTTLRIILAQRGSVKETALFARILDAAVAVVEPHEASDHFSSVRTTALELLQEMVNVVTDPLVWQPVFPGVYAGLYRRILTSLRHVHAKNTEKKVVLLSISVLSSFLGRVLFSNTSPSTGDISSLAKLLSFAKTPNDTVRNEHKVSSGMREDPFVVEAQKRLPATLTSLLSVVANANAPEIRMRALLLVQLLLRNSTRSFWRDDKIATDLSLHAFESCLLLCRDNDQGVAENARSMMRTFEDYLDNLKELVSSRVSELFARIPLLVETSRESELQSSVKVVNCYFAMPQIVSGEVTNKTARSILSGVVESLSLRKTFLPIFNSELTNSNSDTINAAPLTILVDGGVKQLTLPRRRYFSDETLQTVFDLVKTIGNFVGPKRAALLVDEWIADLFQSAVRRASLRLSFYGHSQNSWLRDWSGVPKLTKAIIEGAFTQKGGCRQDHILLQLVESTFPLLLTRPLWTLPTSISEIVVSFDANSEGILKENISFLVDLIDTISILIDFLGSNISGITSLVLLPLLEKAGRNNSPEIRERSVSLLKVISANCGYSCTADFVASQFESDLMVAMQRKLRIPSGRALKPDEFLDEAVLSLVETASTAINLVGSSKLEVSPFSSIIPGMEMLTEELTSRFDHASMSFKDSAPIVLKFIDLYESVMALLRRQEVLEVDDCYENTDQNWFKLISPFSSTLKVSKGSTFTDFEKPSESENCHNATDLARDTRFVSLLAWRCSYLLSHPSLEVRVRSCVVLQHGFRFLGWIHKSGASMDTETNGPKTAVFRQIHSSWSAIILRMKGICNELVDLNYTSLVIGVPHPSATVMPDKGNQRVNLAKLLDLITIMVESAGDFMAERLRQDVWPFLAKLLRGHVGRASYRAKGGIKFVAESETLLLLAIIRLIQSIYKGSCGVALSGLIPAVGDLLFPFLGCEGNVGVETMRSFEAMLCIDSDALWRRLVAMSGASLPTCPFKQSAVVEYTDETRIAVDSANRQQKAAIQLVCFVESMPEKPL